MNLELDKLYKDAQDGTVQCTFIRDGIAYMQALNGGPAYRYTMDGTPLDLSEKWRIVGRAD